MSGEPDPTSGSDRLPEGDGLTGSGPVLYERHGAAAVVSIDRPGRRNAVDGTTAEALHSALMRFESEEGARAMVLTGAGGVAFCAG
ncbi:MAG TPA: enoyl-CoA hydratase-related protein, partial [Solirubrobacteraceae bacterium]|nr:enoyl-CoA hydratase-related protein [Solirubrobacteraceae bacterium]